MSHIQTLPATIEYIKSAHAGQLYGDLPYWHHSVEVMMEASRLFYMYDASGIDLDAIQKAALLHDVIEDTHITHDDLSGLFGAMVASAVREVTHADGSEYLDYIQSLIDSGDKIAMIVKLADNLVNLRGNKDHMTPEKAQRLNDRYTASAEMLAKELGF